MKLIVGPILADMHLFVALGVCGWKMFPGFFVAVFLKQKTGQKKKSG
jgi:hypothetical protein